jgi:hypothetical protein
VEDAELIDQPEQRRGHQQEQQHVTRPHRHASAHAPSRRDGRWRLSAAEKNSQRGGRVRGANI